MPTGYTADLYNGKEIDFRTFALRCARGLGYCIMQRDDPMEDLPKRREPSDYDTKRLNEARERIAFLSTLTPEQAQAEADREFNEEMARRAEYNVKRQAIRVRYEAMLEQVNAWTPPTANHVSLKSLMREQLEKAIDFDCDSYDLPLPERDGQKWLEKERTSAYDTAGRAAEMIEKDKLNCAIANDWIDQLYAGLPAPAIAST